MSDHHDHVVVEKIGSESSWAAVAAVLVAIVLGLVLWFALTGDAPDTDGGGDVNVPVPTTVGS